MLVGFAVNLLMYLSAVPYSLEEAQSKLPAKISQMVYYNPLTHIIEEVSFMLLNTGSFSWSGFMYTFLLSVTVFLLGLMVFNRTEKQFIDTV